VNFSRLLPAKITITRQVTFDFCSSQSTKIPSATEPLDMDTAFSAEDQERIQTTQVPAGGNSRYSTDPGGDTRDKVFLLSIDEANTLFDGDAARQCKPTIFAQAQGASVAQNGNTWWWLRSPGSRSNYAAYVYSDGPIGSLGGLVSSYTGAVRPVVVLRLS